jgi:hypothetical protein
MKNFKSRNRTLRIDEQLEGGMQEQKLKVTQMCVLLKEKQCRISSITNLITKIIELCVNQLLIIF